MSLLGFYTGSASGGDSPGPLTFLSEDALGRWEVLAEAARYEGTRGCMVHMDAARCGAIVVMRRWDGKVLARYPRAEALAAGAISKALAGMVRR